MLIYHCRLYTSMVKTNIQIEKSTRNRLLSIGAKAETYDDIINRILDAFEKR
jgi:hypothetical protein